MNYPFIKLVVPTPLKQFKNGQLPANVLAQALRTLPQLNVSLVGFLEVVQRLLWTLHLRRVVQI